MHKIIKVHLYNLVELTGTDPFLGDGSFGQCKIHKTTSISEIISSTNLTHS